MSQSTHTATAQSVTIIGAGLGGLTLALALKKNGIDSKIYELRTPEYDFGGAIMLSPNALRVLDKLGVYDTVRTLGYNFDTMTFMNDSSHKVVGKYYFGDGKRFEYQALRIHRNVIVPALRKIVQERGVEIKYGRKFSHVVSEKENGVTFALADGAEEHADILIGADGIHSNVRKQMLPGIIPVYSGFLGVTFAFPLSNLRVPSSDFPLPVSIMGTNGTFVMAPQNADGKEIFVGRQFKYPMQDRHSWDALLKERTELIEMHQHDKNQWSDVVQSALEQLDTSNAHSLNIWPFQTVPKLDRWASDGGRVIIVGDAAHAIPPTAGQGANQAFEDSYSLAVLLTRSGSGMDLKTALKRWQDYRQERIDKVLVLSTLMNNIRLSEEEKKALPDEQIWHDAGGDELGWLYLSDIDNDMETVLGQ